MPNCPARKRSKPTMCGEVVHVGADIGARLAEPEGRLDHRHDAGGRHGLVVVGGAGDHVGVGSMNIMTESFEHLRQPRAGANLPLEGRSKPGGRSTTVSGGGSA